MTEQEANDRHDKLLQTPATDIEINAWADYYRSTPDFKYEAIPKLIARVRAETAQLDEMRLVAMGSAGNCIQAERQLREAKAENERLRTQLAEAGKAWHERDRWEDLGSDVYAVLNSLPKPEEA